MHTAMIFDMERNSYVDGPGIRTTVFFKGCNLQCAWCHNPESQSGKKQMMFYKNKCSECGKCKEKCPNRLETCDFCGRCTLFCPNDAREICGREYSICEVLQEIQKDKELYEVSGGGVTCSGGECMLQIDFLEELLKSCKKNGMHTAVDTAGHVPYESFARILPYTDLFLYDIKCYDGDKHRQYTGVDNALILDNYKKLLSAGKKVWVRIPVIPTFNDTLEEMSAIRHFFDTYGRPEKVELLPYHGMGEHKYAAIGRTNQRFEVPSEKVMEEMKRLF